MTLRGFSTSPARASLLGLALLVLLAVPGPGQAEVRRMEAVGMIPVKPGESQRIPPRDAARDAALRDAVRRVAKEQADLDQLLLELQEQDAATPPEAGAPPPMSPEERLDRHLDAALGDRPLRYATRFRVLEDRGERRALFSEDPGAREYVVVIQAHVDTDRVRGGLQRAGIPLHPKGQAESLRLRIRLVDLEGYSELALLQQTLRQKLKLDVVPVEIERGQAVLEVDADRDPRALLRSLVQAAPGKLSIEALEASSDALVLRLSLVAPAEATRAAGFDTPPAKRY